MNTTWDLVYNDALNIAIGCKSHYCKSDSPIETSNQEIIKTGIQLVIQALIRANEMGLCDDQISVLWSLGYVETQKP